MLRSTKKSLLVIFFVALISAACGSSTSTVTSADGTEGNSPSEDVQVEAETTTQAPTDDDGPADGFRRFTFNFSPAEVIDDVYGGDLTTFEVRSSGGSETVVVGFLDETGTIDIPNDIARGGIGVEAELPDDEFCWWSGFYTSTNPARVLTINVELEAICA